MDVDIIENESQEPPSYLTKSAGKRPLKVVVDEAHPLELEAYLGSYSGPQSDTFPVF